MLSQTHSDPPDPEPRVAVVTGAATGAGAATAAALRADGWTVVALDLQAGEAPGTTAVDLLDGDAVAGALADALGTSDRVDLLVTAVDHSTGLAILDLDAASWGRTLDLHLRTVVTAWRAVLPAMVRRGAGAVVAVVPAEGIAGEDEPGRSAAASAVLGAVRALARELGPAGIVVNAVAPKSGPWSATGDADPADVAASVLHLAAGGHYFAGQVLTPAGAVA